MTKYTLIGVLSCVGGGVLIAFQMLSSIMGSKSTWRSLTILDIVGERYNEWMGSVSIGGVERVADTIVHLPLFVLLFCIGVLFFILDYLLGRR